MLVMDWKTLIMACGLAPGFTTSGTAQTREVDRVWYEPPANSSARSNWLPRQLEFAAGTIVKFDRERMELDPIGESQPTMIPSERIIWIEPKYSSELGSQGMQEFSDRRFPEAVPKLFAAIELRPEVWEQQWLTVHLALAAYKVEKYTATLGIVESWSASQPPVPLLGLLPIRWTTKSVSATAIAAARQKLESPENVERLVAASWLLGSPEDQSRAEQTLEKLTNDRRQREVSQLAEAVLWRRTPVPRIESVVEGWLRKIDTMPIALQAGPLLVVADRLRAINEIDRAKELYLSIVLLYQHVGLLADEAKVELQQLN
jgi:hypothetical protein